MPNWKARWPIVAVLGTALPMLAGCQNSPSNALVVEYSIAVLPESDAIRIIDDVRNQRTTIAEASRLIRRQVGNAFVSCSFDANFGVPDPPVLSTIPGTQLGDRNFVIRIIASPLVDTTTSNPAGCSAITDLSFSIGGGTVPGPPSGPQALGPLQLGVPTTDTTGGILLADGRDFRLPEFATGTVRFFNPGPPRRASGEFFFIDSVPMAGSDTAVMIAETRFAISRP